MAEAKINRVVGGTMRGARSGKGGVVRVGGGLGAEGERFVGLGRRGDGSRSWCRS